MATLSLEEKESWLQHKVTKHIIKQLEEDVERIKDSWVAGCYTDNDAYGTIQLNSEASGKAQTLTEIIDFMKDVIDHDFEVLPDA